MRARIMGGKQRCEMKSSHNSGEQKFLKAVYKVNQFISILFQALVCLITLGFLVRAVYCGVCELRGIDMGNRLSSSVTGFFLFSGVILCVKLFIYGVGKLHQKEYSFDPSAMELPERGSITLETALHHMAINMGLIMWDSTFGILLSILLIMMLALGGNIPLILLTCFIMALLLVGGHFLLSWRWKKRSFLKKLARNTEKYWRVGDARDFAAALEESLMKGVLYYAHEMTLTADYIIGLTESDTSFVPVAIPRAEILSIAFYRRRPVMNRYRKYDMGVLKCMLRNGNHVEYLVGQGPRMQRVTKVLNYYRISWKEEELIYE